MPISFVKNPPRMCADQVREGKRSPSVPEKFSHLLGALVLVLALAAPVAAQESRWKELNAQVLDYLRQGKYTEGTPVAQEAVRVAEATFGPAHDNVAIALNNLAALYKAQGKYAEAEPLYRRSLAILEKARGPEHPYVAQPLNNLGLLYQAQGKYAKAEPLYKRVLAIEEKTLGSEHPLVATDLNSLAGLYREQGRYDEAEPLYKRGLAIREKALGPEHPETGIGLRNLAELYYGWGRPRDAQAYFDRAFQNLAIQFEQQFAYMSEKERLDFLHTLSYVFPLYLSFASTYQSQEASLVAKMYDLILWQKGLVVGSVAAQRARLVASGDKQALALLDQLAAKRTLLATLSRTPPSDQKKLEGWRQSFARLQQEANDLEKELVRRSAGFAEERKLARPSWQQVRAALKQGEAAVEIVRFRFDDGKKWTDNHYAALVVTPETTTAPKLVLLGEASKLEGDPLAAYQQHVGLASAATRGGRRVVTEKPAAAPPVGNFYQAFWKPLEAALGGAKRVYLSPDGVLNQVSLGVVPAADGRLLLENYDHRIVSSTKDLLRQPGKPSSNTTVLVGNPDFGLDETTYRAALKSVQRTEVAALRTAPGAAIARSAELRGGSLNPLPGTQVEVEAVSSVLTKQRWNVE